MMQMSSVALQFFLLHQQSLQQFLRKEVRTEAKFITNKTVRFQFVEFLQGVNHHHFLQLCQQFMDFLSIFMAI